MANSPTYGPNPFAVTNADDPLSVFKLTPNPIQRLSDALSLIVNLGQQQKASPSSASTPQRPAPQQPPSPVPQRPAATPPIIPISQTWRPAPPPTRPFPIPPETAPGPTPEIPEPPNVGASTSTVSYPGMGEDPSNSGMPSVIPSGMPDVSQIPGWGAPPTGTDVTSNVSYPDTGTQDASNQDTGFWGTDPFNNPIWVANPGANSGDGGGDGPVTTDPSTDFAAGDLGSGADYSYFDSGGGDMTDPGAYTD